MDFKRKKKRTARVYGHWSLAKTKFGCQTIKKQQLIFLNKFFKGKKVNTNTLSRNGALLIYLMTKTNRKASGHISRPVCRGVSLLRKINI